MDVESRTANEPATGRAYAPPAHASNALNPGLPRSFSRQNRPDCVRRSSGTPLTPYRAAAASDSRTATTDYVDFYSRHASVPVIDRGVFERPNKVSPDRAALG